MAADVRDAFNASCPHTLSATSAQTSFRKWQCCFDAKALASEAIPLVAGVNATGDAAGISDFRCQRPRSN